MFVNDWHRRGLLAGGGSFGWHWHLDGERTGSIGVRVLGGDAVSLDYMIGDGQDKRDASQHVRLTRTTCHYGGARLWFACPVCQHRVGVLFLRSGRFACRTCQRVAYASQSCDALDRMWRKQSKLEARLDEHWARPKGMHHNTYERLIDALENCEYRRNVAFVETASRLFGAAGLAELESMVL